MRLRPAEPADAAAVAALWTEAYTEDERGGRTTRYREAEFEEAAALGEVWVAEHEKRLAGVVVLYPPGVRDGQFAAEGELELSRLCVARNLRRRGLARSLVEHCIERADQCRAAALVLWSQPHQTEAHRLYESLGFRRVPERDASSAEGPQLVFVRSII
jgi:ribosomal protein S18 acetylase RimI-like enzyme